MKRKKRFGNVTEIAAVLGTSEGWAGSILARLGVPVGNTGTYLLPTLLDALEAAAQGIESTRSASLSLEEVSDDKEECLRWLVHELERRNVNLVFRHGRRGANMKFKNTQDSVFSVFAYVSLQKKENGQVGFTLNKLASRRAKWYVFIAKPLGKAFIRSKDELIEAYGEDDKPISLTFSPGSDVHLFEHNVGRLLSGY